MLYTVEGYVNINYVDSANVPFNILIGGRGTGKTFGTLKYLIENNRRVIYLRRSDVQNRICSSTATTPYKSVCASLGVEYKINKDVVKTLYIGTDAYAYFMALSTFHNIRGFDSSDVTDIVFDEFIPEIGSRPIPNEAESLFNAYETINRNRELNGISPVKLWMLSNANTIVSPLLSSLNLVSVISRMSKCKSEKYIDSERGVQLIILNKSPISEKKMETALYKVAGGRFTDMSIHNDFGYKDVKIKSFSFNELRPIARLGDISFYSINNYTEIYASFHSHGDMLQYYNDSVGVNRFLQEQHDIYVAFKIGEMIFENLDVYVGVSTSF